MYFRSQAKFARRTPRAGFSLIELMVVLAIIGMLAAAVSVGVVRARDKGRITTAEMAIGNIVEGLEMFNNETARYPSEDEGLEILLQRTGGLAPILKNKGELSDPWGNAFVYRILVDEDEPFEVSSAGLDGIHGSPDDLSNLEAN